MIMFISTPQLFTLPPLEGYQRIKVKIKRAHTYKGREMREIQIPTSTQGKYDFKQAPL